MAIIDESTEWNCMFMYFFGVSWVGFSVLIAYLLVMSSHNQETLVMSSPNQEINLISIYFKEDPFISQQNFTTFFNGEG